MPKDNDYKEYILDQLAPLGDVYTKKMFSSFGFYLDGRFFAILSKNRLYFKTNKTTSEKYIQEGMQPFKPSQKQILKNYFEVPADIIENPLELQEWAEEASWIKN